MLSRFSVDPRPSVQEELNKAWAYFDPREYAERVLAARAEQWRVTVWRSPGQLAALEVLPPLADLYAVIDGPQPELRFLRRHAPALKRLTLMFDEPGVDMAELPGMANLSWLSLGVPGLVDLGFLDDLPELRSIWLPYCEEVRDFGPLKRHSRLDGLAVQGSSRLTALDQLPSLHEVTTLGLQRSSLSCGLRALVEAAPSVETLFLSGCHWLDDLGALAALPLRQLDLDKCTAVHDIEPLASAKGLAWLDLSRTRISGLAPLAGLRDLRQMHLDGCDGITDLGPLASLRSLTALSLRGATPGIDLSPLAGNRKLTVHISAGQQVRGAEALGRRLKVS